MKKYKYTHLNDGTAVRRCRKMSRSRALGSNQGRQCEKPQSHNKTDYTVTHQAGAFTWHDEQVAHNRPAPTEGRGLRTDRVVFDEAHVFLGDTNISDKVTGVTFEYDTTPIRPDLYSGGPLTGPLGSLNVAGSFDTDKAGRRFVELVHETLRKKGPDAQEAEPTEPTEREELATELRQWWFDKADAETDMVVAKAIEYGSTDLIDIGLMLGRTMKRQVSEEEAAELGVFFYVIGKIARWQSAIERGERPSDDTLLDIGVYVRMAQRIRSAGGWPGTDPHTNEFDDSIGAPAPCQPIGCDAGLHRPGCYYNQGDTAE